MYDKHNCIQYSLMILVDMERDESIMELSDEHAEKTGQWL